MKTNYYDIKINNLMYKYSRFVDEFKGCEDDRQVFCAMYNNLIKACKEMKKANIENPFIKVAFDEKVNQEKSVMDDIIRRFTGNVWSEEECGWVNKT